MDEFQKKKLEYYQKMFGIKFQFVHITPEQLLEKIEKEREDEKIKNKDNIKKI